MQAQVSERHPTIPFGGVNYGVATADAIGGKDPRADWGTGPRTPAPPGPQVGSPAAHQVATFGLLVAGVSAVRRSPGGGTGGPRISPTPFGVGERGRAT